MTMHINILAHRPSSEGNVPHCFVFSRHLLIGVHIADIAVYFTLVRMPSWSFEISLQERY